MAVVSRGLDTLVVSLVLRGYPLKVTQSLASRLTNNPSVLPGSCVVNRGGGGERSSGVWQLEYAGCWTVVCAARARIFTASRDENDEQILCVSRAGAGGLPRVHHIAART